MNISQATKNRIQVKTESSSAYLTEDSAEIVEADILCLSNPSLDYYEGNILYTAGEYDINNTIIFAYQLNDQIAFHLIGEEVNIVFVNKPLKSEKEDTKALESIDKCHILITNILNIDDLSPLVSTLTPNVVCVTEGFLNSENYEKVKTLKIKMSDLTLDDENVRYVLLQK